LSCGLRQQHRQHPQDQKFFASFFQKRSAFFDFKTDSNLFLAGFYCFALAPSLVVPMVEPALIVFLPDAALSPLASMAPDEESVLPLVVTPLAPPDMLLPDVSPMVAELAGDPGAVALDVPLAEAPPLVCANATPDTASIAAKEIEKSNLRILNLMT
jgi:hypothetical protein